MGNVGLASERTTKKGIFYFICSKQCKKTDIIPVFLQLPSNIKQRAGPMEFQVFSLLSLNEMFLARIKVRSNLGPKDYFYMLL